MWRDARGSVVVTYRQIRAASIAPRSRNQVQTMQTDHQNTIPAARGAAANMALVLTGALGIAICSQMRIYLGFTPVPVTLQVFGVLLAGFVLGPRKGAVSALAYGALGAAGAPVFAGLQGGPGYLLASGGGLFAPTMGYLLAFPLAAWVAGSLWQRHRRGDLAMTAVACLAGVAVIYAGGFVWQAAQRMAQMGFADGLYLAFLQGVVPFALIDIAKALCAAALADAVQLRR